jgi:hypothetical protein
MWNSFDKKSHYERYINRKYKCEINNDDVVADEQNVMLEQILEELKNVKKELKEVKADNVLMKKNNSNKN